MFTPIFAKYNEDWKKLHKNVPLKNLLTDKQKDIFERNYLDTLYVLYDYVEYDTKY